MTVSLKGGIGIKFGIMNLPCPSKTICIEAIQKGSELMKKTFGAPTNVKTVKYFSTAEYKEACKEITHLYNKGNEDIKIISEPDTIYEIQFCLASTNLPAPMVENYNTVNSPPLEL